MGNCFETMEQKIKTIPDVSQAFMVFVQLYCTTGEGEGGRMEDISKAFALYLLGTPKLRNEIGTHFDEPRVYKGSSTPLFNIRLWQHYSHETLLRLFVAHGLVYIADWNDKTRGAVLGLRLVRWPPHVVDKLFEHGVSLLHHDDHHNRAREW